MIDFEFDDDKSKANLEKHGIDFQAAQELWNDPDILEIRAKSDDERRFLVIGLIGAKHWSAVVTYRSERVRLISVRRSRKKEVELYES
ncbi:BrnT family toxin [Salinivibrio socompensis]|uniref:BrnT family toxin n=1 Tax=Salinivibrio socompensis TaxID=1510206 RepID=UPI000472F1F4|nr:BrnT family toxin [Salinivibrio socompensis]